MEKAMEELLRKRLDTDNYNKLAALKNSRLNQFISDAIILCDPQHIAVCDDSPESMAMTQQKALETKEETTLAIKGHTVHFDGMQDQGRDRKVTRYLVPKGESFPKTLNQIEREAGLAEVRGLMKGSMKGRTMIVRFLTLGPNNSVFSIPCIECTDSWYVSHSLNLLYRQGYEIFDKSVCLPDPGGVSCLK